MVKIKNFKYVAKDLNGKIHKGRTESPNKQLCKNYLEDKNLKIISIVEYSNIVTKLNDVQIGSILKPKDIVFYLKQLSSLLKSGMRVSEASLIIANQTTNKPFRKLLYQVHYELENGLPLSEALSMHKEFPLMMTKMISIGEQTGDMITIVDDTADYFDNQLKMIKGVKSALTAPIVYFSLAITVTISMLLFIFPVYATMLEGTDNIPFISKIFMDASDFLLTNVISFSKQLPDGTFQEMPGLYVDVKNLIIIDFSETYSININYRNLLILTVLFVVSIVGFKKIRKKNKYKRLKSKIILKLPLAGTIIKLSNISKISSSIAKLAQNKIDMVVALNLTKDIITNHVYKDILEEAITNVESGSYMSNAFENHWAVDEIVPKLISVGEKSGDIEGMLISLSNYYNEDIEDKFQAIKDKIQPILMMFIYGIIGSLLIAMMLPTITAMSNVE